MTRPQPERRPFLTDHERTRHDAGFAVNDVERPDNPADSRVLPDRRTPSWRTFVFGYFFSRRREHRRGPEQDNVFIDWHHPWLFFLAIGIMLLSTLDAFLTLQLLSKGATEINPVMAAMLEHGHIAFAASKMLLTGLGIMVLVFLSRLRLFNFLRTGLLLTLFFSFYACLVCYQGLLLMRVH
jgi:hypothetical protein